VISAAVHGAAGVGGGGLACVAAARASGREPASVGAATTIEREMIVVAVFRGMARVAESD
jgi:hypothetical protein